MTDTNDTRDTNDGDGKEPIHFLGVAPDSEGARGLFDFDVSVHGFVMNASRLWAHQPQLHDELFDLIGASAAAVGLSMRHRGILVSATAATCGDSYCSLAWGARLAAETSGALAAAVLRGDDDGLTQADRALATWARGVVDHPNDLTAADVEPLRAAGFGDAQIVAITLFVALRMAFSTINDALGARPERALVEHAPPDVVAAVTYGRRPVG